MTRRPLGLVLLLMTGCAAERRIVEPSSSPLAPMPKSPASVSEAPSEPFADGLSLDKTLELAAKNNPHLRSVRREMGLAGAERITAGQWSANPVLSSEIARATPLGRAGDSRLRVGLSQEFEIAGQRGRRIGVAEANLDRTRAAIADAERLLRAEATALFGENLMLDERADLTARNVGITEQMLAAAQARFDAQQIPETDLNLVRLQHQQAKNENARTISRRRAARLRLAALLGEPSRAEFSLAGTLDAVPSDLSRDRTLAAAKETRPDLLALETEIRMARRQVDLERANVWPNPEVGAFYERESAFLGPWADRDHVVGLEFRLPLPIVNRREGEIAEARARLRILESSRADLDRQIERDVDLALERVKTARETVRTYESEINRLSQSNLEAFQKAYQAGEVGTLEVLRAQEDFNRVSEAYQDARLEYHTARAELESAAGGRIPE